MEIKLPVVNDDSEGTPTYLPSSLHFDEVGPGTFRGIVPVVFQDPTKSNPSAFLRSTYPITINAEATDAQKGRRRILLKASMPYRRAALTTSGTTPMIGGDSGEISIHTVVSVPKVLIQDLTVPNPDNTDARYVASATLAMLLQLQRSLSMFLGVVGAANYGDNTGSSALLQNKILRPTLEGESVALGEETGILKVSSPCRILPDFFTVKEDDITGQPTIFAPCGVFDLGSTGLQNYSQRSIADVAADPLVRGLIGLRPIEEGTNITAMSYVTELP